MTLPAANIAAARTTPLLVFGDGVGVGVGPDVSKSLDICKLFPSIQRDLAF